MRVHQLSIRHIAEQDRLLLRLNNAEGEEYRLWLTRRMLATLWPHLNEVARATRGANELTQDEAGRKMLNDFRKDEALQQADFNTPFNAQPAALPLGEEPLLVTHTHFAVNSQGLLDIMFEEILPEQRVPRGFTVQLNFQLLVGMLRLTEKALEAADWRLDSPDKPAPRAEAEAPAEPPQRPRYLN